MAVKSSGSLSLTTDIVGEFGGVAPHSLSEYYGGGTYVPAGANPGIATSGQINMGSHYGAVAATVLTISSNVNNYDIGAAAIAAGGDKSTPVILTINPGVTVGSTSSGTAAMYTGTGWSSGTTINITNNGSIVGASGSNINQTGTQTGTGGSGGRGWSGIPWNTVAIAGNSGSTGAPTSDAGANGGDAFEHSQTSDNNLSVIFDTTGTRSGGSGGSISAAGGGGGGGGGGSSPGGLAVLPGGGGGGGAGTNAGSGGAGGIRQAHTTCGSDGGNGSAGTSTTGGGGGAGGSASGCGNDAGKAGGAGGNLGNAGSSGGSGGWASGKAGGSAGSTGNLSGTVGSALAGNTGQIS